MDYLVTDTELTGIANAIRTKGGTNASLEFPTGFVSAISSISTVNNQAKTNITPTESSQTIEPDSGYTGLSSVQINAISSTYVGSGIASKSSSDLSASGKTVTVPAGYYASQATKDVATGAYSPSVSAHLITTTPVVTAAISGTITNIGTTTQPSGTNGTDYWTITPSGSVTTPGVSSARATATIGTAGYIAAGSTESSANTVNVTAVVNDGTARYIPKGTITNNTSGGTSEGTISGGSQIKIGAGYYPSDLYYTAAQSGGNSGTITIDEDYNANENISCDGYVNVNITGINIPIPSSGTNAFTIKVPNGSGNAYFTFTVDTSGNVVVTAG